MKRCRVVFSALLLMLAACGTQGPAEHDEHEAAAAPAAAHDAEGEEGTVRIDPGMVRDLRITTASVESREEGEGITALGELGVDEEAYAEVGSPVEARILSMNALPGAAVKPGQPLVELQSAELGRARAAHLAAKARMALATQNLERKRGLAAERIAPVREVQEAEAEASAAQAELSASRAALQSLGVEAGEEAVTDASRFTLQSPIKGTVISRDGARGQMVDPSRTLVRVADLSRLWLTVHAFERDAVRVIPGTQARITFPALPGRDFSGTVTLVGREVDISSRTIPVRVEIANQEGLLRPGMSATAWLSAGGSGAAIVSVPTACLQRMQDGWYVFLPREAGLFEMREVGRGRDLGGEVEILSGLQPGEIVVVEGAFLLKAEAEKSRGEGEHHEH
jgi:cobalt-zinc-cadmium efflux system membrane fusion protein